MIRSVRNGCGSRVINTTVVRRTLGKTLASGYAACIGSGNRLRGCSRMGLTHRLRLRYAVCNALGNRIVDRLGM